MGTIGVIRTVMAHKRLPKKAFGVHKKNVGMYGKLAEDQISAVYGPDSPLMAHLRSMLAPSFQAELPPGEQPRSLPKTLPRARVHLLPPPMAMSMLTARPVTALMVGLPTSLKPTLIPTEAAAAAMITVTLMVAAAAMITVTLMVA